MVVPTGIEKSQRSGEPGTDVERVMARYNVGREEAERWLGVYPGEKLLSDEGAGFGRSSAAEPTDKELETKIERLRAELEVLRDEVHDRLRGVRLSDWVTSPESPGIVINEERAKATPCKCFTYKGKDYCYSAGVIGMLEAGQVPTYCPTKKYEVRPGIKERFEEFAEAAEAAHKRIEQIPKGERLIPWVTEMGRELRARGIEV